MKRKTIVLALLWPRKEPESIKALTIGMIFATVKRKMIVGMILKSKQITRNE